MSNRLSEKTFIEIQALIHSLTGITIGSNRKSMVEGRLKKRLRELEITDFESYIQLVNTQPKEAQIFIDLVTTNETYFFRTPRIWDYIEKTFLPSWFTKNPSKTFSAWSAAASSGEEAHSLGVLCQSFKDTNPGFNYKILGTDISQDILTKCNKGLYSGRSIASFKQNRSSLFEKYLVEDLKGSYKVVPEISSRITFKQHNLFNRLNETIPFDLILLRNVLIYFTNADQEKVISNIAPKLSKEGSFIIGESETLSRINTPFKNSQPLIYTFDDSLHLKKAG